jgi:hypothetical protein
LVELACRNPPPNLPTAFQRPSNGLQKNRTTVGSP